MIIKNDEIFQDVKHILRPQGVESIHRDRRGWFKESFREDILGVHFVQENMSMSNKGVIRGLHFQNPKPQGKLVNVLRGEIIDYYVDLRKNSPTYKKWNSCVINKIDGRSIYIPEGFAHGFVAIQESEVVYKCTDYYSPEDEYTLNFFDEEISIDMSERVANINMSLKDIRGKHLKELELLNVLF